MALGTAASADGHGPLTVFGTWLGPDQAAVEAVLDGFTAATGHEYSYVGSDSSEQQILIDAEAGSAPNIAVFPQPGLASDFASKGFLTPLADGTDDWIRENYAAGQSWVDLGIYGGADGADDLYGFFFKADVKSLVWYSPENFEDAGYDIPETMEELKALTDQIVADGGTPWCIGLGSGAATGWPATDWVEEMMLRTQPPAVYDEWVANSMPFTDERVVAAIEEFGVFARNDDYVAGGLLLQQTSVTAQRVCLAHLHSAMRVATRIEIAQLKESMPESTMIYVTHDQVEAMTLASRIVVLANKGIAQVGTPLELYERPKNEFVAQFIGSPSMNLLSGEITDTGAETTITLDGGGKVKSAVPTQANDKGLRVNIGIRPKDLIETIS